MPLKVTTIWYQFPAAITPVSPRKLLVVLEDSSYIVKAIFPDVAICSPYSLVEVEDAFPKIPCIALKSVNLTHEENENEELWVP